MTINEKTGLILHIVNKENISAYNIHKNTTISATGIGNIINGKTTVPHVRTIDEILNYLINKYPVYKNNKTVFQIGGDNAVMSIDTSSHDYVEIGKKQKSVNVGYPEIDNECLKKDMEISKLTAQVKTHQREIELLEGKNLLLEEMNSMLRDRANKQL